MTETQKADEAVTYENRDGQRVAVVPLGLFERMIDDLDDLADIKAYDRTRATPPEALIPAAIVDRLIAGEQPIRVWREHRGLTAAILADRTKISRAYLSQLEHGRRLASQAVLRRLASALELEIGDLITEPSPS